MKLQQPGLIFLLVIWTFTLKAQKEANMWFFGENIGLDFSNGTPTPLTNSAMKSIAGCAVANDPATGKLLFYTNGEKIWNRNHEVMPQGDGLAGSNYARQGSLIVSMPDEGRKFYLFTLSHADYLRPYASLSYSIIDMDLNNGNGDVVTKNVLLADHVVEKQTAVPHSNGNDFWLIAHEAESNSFLTFLISASGISNSGAYPIGPGYFSTGQNPYTFTGCALKASPNGKLLATGMLYYSETGADFVKGPVQLYDFDAMTGAISNYRNLGTLVCTAGVSFSPDNTKLYVYGYDTEYLEASGDDLDIIYQWDLSGTSLTEIIDSKVPLFSSKNTVTHIGEKALGVSGDIQIGPDGKIYAAGNITIADQEGSIVIFSRNSLFVIERPNKRGFDSYVTIKFFNFGTGKVRTGLPNFIQSYFNGLEPIDNPNVPCNSENSFMLYPNPTSGAFKIIVSQDCFQPYTISVYTILGQKIFEQSISSSDSDPVDITHLAQGTYIVRSNFSGWISKKIVKIN